MKKAIRIKDWNKHFENSESRKLKKLSYVCLPNKHDGKGFARVAKHRNSIRVLCGWTLILEVASKLPQRGLLVDEDGPLSAEDIADMTRFPEEVIQTAIDVLKDPKIGWLEEVECPNELRVSGRSNESVAVYEAGQDDKGNDKKKQDDIPRNPETSRNVPVYPEKSCTNRTEQNRTEQKRGTHTAREEPEVLPGFDPPTLEHVIDQGHIYGIHPNEAKTYFLKRDKDDWFVTNNVTGLKERIKNWRKDLAYQHQRGWLKNQKPTNNHGKRSKNRHWDGKIDAEDLDEGFDTVHAGLEAAREQVGSDDA